MSCFCVPEKFTEPGDMGFSAIYIRPDPKSQTQASFRVIHAGRNRKTPGERDGWHTPEIVKPAPIVRIPGDRASPIHSSQHANELPEVSEGLLQVHSRVHAPQARAAVAGLVISRFR
jgi:hypothetical protein